MNRTAWIVVAALGVALLWSRRSSSSGRGGETYRNLTPPVSTSNAARLMQTTGRAS